MTTDSDCTKFIDARPNMCYRTLERELMDTFPDLRWQDDRYCEYLMSVRPNCGYDCDGGGDPDPITGKIGCPVSGVCES